jgi:hypothetical protein
MLDDNDLDIGSTGETANYLRFNAKSKEWKWRDENGEITLTGQIRFIMDLANVQTGWIKLMEGSPPDRVPDPSRIQRARRPSEAHRRGFISRVASRTSFAGTGEFCSAAVGTCGAVRELYAQFRAQAADHPGEVPVIGIAGYSAFKGRFGTNFSPEFVITGWVARPDDLPDEPVLPVEPKGNGPVTKGAAFDAALGNDSIPY